MRGRELSRYSPQKEEAISYAQVRACFRFGEIRIVDASGRIERVIPFNDTSEKCEKDRQSLLYSRSPAYIHAGFEFRIEKNDMTFPFAAFSRLDLGHSPFPDWLMFGRTFRLVCVKAQKLTRCGAELVGHLARLADKRHPATKRASIITLIMRTATASSLFKPSSEK